MAVDCTLWVITAYHNELLLFFNIQRYLYHLTTVIPLYLKMYKTEMTFQLFFLLTFLAKNQLL